MPSTEIEPSGSQLRRAAAPSRTTIRCTSAPVEYHDPAGHDAPVAGDRLDERDLPPVGAEAAELHPVGAVPRGQLARYQVGGHDARVVPPGLPGFLGHQDREVGVIEPGRFPDVVSRRRHGGGATRVHVQDARRPAVLSTGRDDSRLPLSAGTGRGSGDVVGHARWVGVQRRKDIKEATPVRAEARVLDRSRDGEALPRVEGGIAGDVQGSV